MVGLREKDGILPFRERREERAGGCTTCGLPADARPRHRVRCNEACDVATIIHMCVRARVAGMVHGSYLLTFTAGKTRGVKDCRQAELGVSWTTELPFAYCAF